LTFKAFRVIHREAIRQYLNRVFAAEVIIDVAMPKAVSIAAPSALAGTASYIKYFAKVIDVSVNVDIARSRLINLRICNEPLHRGRRSERYLDSPIPDARPQWRHHLEISNAPPSPSVVAPMIWAIAVLEVALASDMDWLITLCLGPVRSFLLRLELGNFPPVDHDCMMRRSGARIGGERTVLDESGWHGFPRQ
jgi:hypothetical protein